LRKIGLFGGTFDPVHTGHLLLADAVRGDAGLDKILFVPAAVPPHKPGGPKSGADDRLHMVHLATEGNPGFGVEDLELRRTGASYTVDTLAELQVSGEWKDVEWFLLMGADMLADLPNWKNPDEIIRRAGLLVMERPGFDVRDRETRFVRNAVFVNTPSLGISSTQIRRRIREGKSIRYWVPAAVESFIREKGLYRT
jgi:nicotinate-nucleotide adenylyltransferase